MLGKRIFTYYYRLYDYYGSENIVSLVVLADSEANRRPDRYENEMAGCRVCQSSTSYARI